MMGSIDNIRQKLEEVRRRYQWEMNPVILPEELEKLEAFLGVHLPEGYRTFLLEIGNGGPGPQYGIHSLQDSVKNLSGWPVVELFQNLLSKPFPQTEYYNFWSEKNISYLSEKGVEGDEIGRLHDEGEAFGLLDITRSNVANICDVKLVVTGATRGEMWVYLGDGESGGYFPLRVSFLEWYERWLDHVLDKQDGIWWRAHIENMMEQYELTGETTCLSGKPVWISRDTQLKMK